ncbi:MAG TPA: sigma-70 family RNA polymerase sigma factor [Candidatus Binatia bacterium]|nr:sigma-70 family RNA polymerase sigma factor [Candidatus Binatia bacterium]
MASFLKLPSWPTVTDEQAMWRVKMDDDPHAFARLVERWQQPIQRLCVRMLGDAHRAEDLTQEAFAKVFARRKDYEPVGRFSTFLWRIALNLCYDELRKINRRGESSLEDSADEHGELHFAAANIGPDLQVVRDERAESVRRALLQLPEPYRVVVVLRHYEGLKFREIGEVLDIPEGTVKSRMVEALNQLSRALKPLVQDEPPAKI